MLRKDKRSWQKSVVTLHKNVLIIESVIGNTDDTKVVLLYSVSVYVTIFAKTRHLRTQWQRTFSPPINRSINKLTNCHNTTATS